MRFQLKVPWLLARVSKNLSRNLGLAPARVSDLNETGSGSFQITIENDSPWPKSTTAARLRTRVSYLRSYLGADQRFRTDVRESGTLARTLFCFNFNGFFNTQISKLGFRGACRSPPNFWDLSKTSGRSANTIEFINKPIKKP